MLQNLIEVRLSGLTANKGKLMDHSTAVLVKYCFELTLASLQAFCETIRMMLFGQIAFASLKRQMWLYEDVQMKATASRTIAKQPSHH